MKLLKKTLKIISYSLVIILLIAYTLFSYFTSPKSESYIINSFKESRIKPIISTENFNGFEYRKLEIKSDTTLPTIVFIHGTVGSVNDYNKFLKDSSLQQKANMIAYDRIGYNYKDKNSVQENIAFENNMLNNIISELNPEKTILFGYSYGGPIALSIKQKVKKIILLAPAVYSEAESMPWLIIFYKWKLTRWLVPRVWKEASKEKLSHKKDLQKHEDNWKSTKSYVISIHGTSDAIVPFSNSLFLQEQFPSNQFQLIKINDVGHEILWTKFDLLKQQLLNELD